MFVSIRAIVQVWARKQFTARNSLRICRGPSGVGVCVSGLPLASCRPTEPAMELSTVKRGTWNERDRGRGRERRVASERGAGWRGRAVSARSTHFFTGLDLQALLY